MTDMEKIVITGDSGFVGQYLVSYFLKAGNIVYGLSRHKQFKNSSENYFHISCDLCDEISVMKAFEEIKCCDVIIHLAAYVCIPGNIKLYEDNCLSTFNIAGMANKYAAYFIYFSSIPIIGNPVDLPITENHIINPLTFYHKSKYESELILDKKLDIPLLIFRMASPIGKNMPQNFLPIIIDKAVKNENIVIWGKGTRVQNYIDVRDIFEAVKCGITNHATGVFNLSGTNISNIELARKCIEIINSESHVILDCDKDGLDEEKWIVSGEKVKNELGFISRYTIDESIMWIKEGYI